MRSIESWMTSGEPMDFADWEPIYESIVADFGYDRLEDERARDRLGALVSPFALDRLDLDGQRVAIVVGAGLDDSGVRLSRAYDTVIATGDALARLEAGAVPVRLTVTDLDSYPARVCRRTRRGAPVGVHAHGDNLDAVDRWVPRMARSAVLGTTQARPEGGIVNVGGFTDGDRAAYLADALGADSLGFIGWDLDDATVGPTKRRKLDWAARLLTHLEAARAERYAVLDGHRVGLDESTDR